VSVKLLFLVLQNKSVAITRVLMLLLLTKNVVFFRVLISILVLLQAVLVNVPAVIWGLVLNDVAAFGVTVLFL
jgi:hypothetical protein